MAVKWQDQRTNEEIRAVVQRKETVMDTIRMRNLQLFGHICRMPDDRLLKRHCCLEWLRVSVVRDDLHEDGLMTF